MHDAESYVRFEVRVGLVRGADHECFECGMSRRGVVEDEDGRTDGGHADGAES